METTNPLISACTAALIRRLENRAVPHCFTQSVANPAKNVTALAMIVQAFITLAQHEPLPCLRLRLFARSATWLILCYPFAFQLVRNVHTSVILTVQTAAECISQSQLQRTVTDAPAGQ